MEPDTMAAVASYETEADAKANAASLVEHGLGAAVGATDDGRWSVSVLPADRARALERLGLPDPDEATADDSEQLTRSVRSMLVPVLVGIAVLVLVPLIAFFVSFKLSGG